MRIAIIVLYFPPKWIGGTEIATYDLAEHLARRGHEIHIITSLDKGQLKESYERGFYIHRVFKPKIKNIGILIFWINALKILQEIDADIVHAQSLGNAIPAVIYKKIKKIPYTVWGQGLDVNMPGWFIKKTAKTCLANADAIIALSDNMKNTMQLMSDREVVVIPNGIDLTKYDEGQRKQRTHRKTIIYVGRLHAVKGVQYLLEAMSAVHRKVPQAELVIVGDGNERAALETLTDQLGIRECVKFVGMVPHEQVTDWMYNADIFVLPSISEGFPLVVLEAMACGLPVVATRVGVLPEIIEDGTNGFVVDAKSPYEIADKLLTIMQSDELYEKMSVNGKKIVEKFSWNNITEIIEGVYREIIANIV